MIKPERLQNPTSIDGLQWLVTDDGSRTLWDERLGESYHSGCGAVAESLTVYLINSGVYERLKLGQSTRVLEFGFGTGTAFLLTAAAAILHRTRLHYRALEMNLLPADVLQGLEIHSAQLSDKFPAEFQNVISIAHDLLDELIHWRTKLPAGVALGTFACSFYNNIELELIMGDAVKYCVDPHRKFDAVYFDLFSPQSCPELWCPSIFRIAIDSLEAGGSLATYCVKRVVREQLAQTGFEVRKLAGPIEGKREVLVAKKSQ